MRKIEQYGLEDGSGTGSESEDRHFVIRGWLGNGVAVVRACEIE